MSGLSSGEDPGQVEEELWAVFDPLLRSRNPGAQMAALDGILLFKNRKALTSVADLRRYWVDWNVNPLLAASLGEMNEAVSLLNVVRYWKAVMSGAEFTDVTNLMLQKGRLRFSK